MGWAARAKDTDWQSGKSVSRGNPETVELRARTISAEEFDKGSRRAKFSDRMYVMDQHGTLRRVQPPLFVTTQMIGPSPPPTT